MCDHVCFIQKKQWLKCTLCNFKKKAIQTVEQHLRGISETAERIRKEDEARWDKMDGK